MRFLVLQPAFLGDVILALSVPQKLKRFYPKAEIHFLVRKGFENLAENHPDVDKIWLFDRKQNKILELLRVIRCLRAYHFDAVINLHRFFSSGIICSSMNSNLKIGYDKNPFSFMYDEKIKHYFSAPYTPQPIHEVERYLKLIESLTDSSFERPKLYPTLSDNEKVAKYKTKGAYLVIAPSSLWETKRLPIEKWVEFIKTVALHYQIYLVGSKEDIPTAEYLSSVNPDQIENLCGQLTLLQSASLMDGATRVFCNDSAPMHLATAVNAPTTAVFCSTVPAFGFGPLAEDAQIVQINEKLDCRPCGIHGHSSCPKGHFKCGYGVDVQDLLNTLS